LTVFPKDAIVFGFQEQLAAIMKNPAQASLSSWKPVPWLRAELFRVLILLVIFIITGVAVTPGASG
jgi:hypothetical protein